MSSTVSPLKNSASRFITERDREIRDTKQAMELKNLTDALSTQLPEVCRWAGAVARRLRYFNIALSGKSSGSSNTDALTLADLTVQELVVSALRDRDPLFRNCRLEAEEETGDLHCFATDSPYTIALDPIDGTKEYRDRTGDGYAVILTLRSTPTVHYSLVYLPEMGDRGTWVEARENRIVCGEDDPLRPAAEVLQGLPVIDQTTRPDSKNIYLIGFQDETPSRAQDVTDAGFRGFAPDEMPGSIYPLLARGEFGGSLIHTPNIYDFPVSLQIARILGGEAAWVHNGEPVHFAELWNDERAEMLRLPGIIACSPNRETVRSLCRLARDWSPIRYRECD